MRVIAGEARGRRLRAPAGKDTRPTPDRVREALFSILGPDVVDGTVLDLFAGSGALAIEALSRGARRAVLVEREPRALDAIRHNLDALGFADRARVVAADASRFCDHPGEYPGAFDLVFCDPPYRTSLEVVVRLVTRLADAGGLAPWARVVVERDRRDPLLADDRLAALLPPRLAREAVRSYGDTVLLLLRHRGEDPNEEAT